MTKLHIVFQDFPGPDDRCVFVEVETPDGRSVNAGEWRKRDDGFVELVIDNSVPPSTIDALKQADFWLEGALQCKSWNWDADQHEAASGSLSAIREAVNKAEKP